MNANMTMPVNGTMPAPAPTPAAPQMSIGQRIQSLVNPTPAQKQEFRMRRQEFRNRLTQGVDTALMDTARYAPMIGMAANDLQKFL